MTQEESYRLECGNCGNEWDYTGKYVEDMKEGKSVNTNCPRCGYNVYP